MELQLSLPEDSVNTALLSTNNVFGQRTNPLRNFLNWQAFLRDPKAFGIPKSGGAYTEPLLIYQLKICFGVWTNPLLNFLNIFKNPQGFRTK